MELTRCATVVGAVVALGRRAYRVQLVAQPHFRVNTCMVRQTLGDARRFDGGTNNVAMAAVSGRIES
jgi:hypothetical protein